LQQLGHDVFFLEDSDDYPSCYDPSRHVVDADPSYGLQFAGDVFSQLDCGDRWAYYDAHTSTWMGPLGDRAIEIAENADVCLNLSGVNPLRPWLMSIPARGLVDTDPVFTQIRHLTDAAARRAAGRHTSFHTFAENFGSPACTVPADGFPWQPTRQPLVPSAWPFTTAPAEGLFTTVMQWDSYPAVEFANQRYGMKSESFQPYKDLPGRVGTLFELAIGTEHAPRKMLQERGWRLRDPLEITRTPWTYQDYIQRSRGEFSVAKHGYVASNSGWFSERSVGYLASGRPVITQDTGFSRWLPTGTGLLPFSSPSQAAAALEDVAREAERHGRAAYEIAMEFFDFRKVLPKLLEQCMTADAPIARRSPDGDRSPE
jgi:hypothetical protein